MKWKPVLAAVDGSPESLRALAVAWRIARAADAPCIPVYAIPEVWAPAGLALVVNLPEVVDPLVTYVRRQMDTELSGEVPSHVRQALVARAGRPGVVLDDVARETGASLIVVGGRHHGALARGLGGSTAHHLVRTAPAPVLIVDASNEAGPFRRMLVASDLFPNAGAVLSAAGRFAAVLGAEVRVLHVVEPAKFPVILPLAIDMTVLEDRAREEFERLVDVELPQVAPQDRVVRCGRADDEIVEEAAAADLLVVGSHGRGWIDRMLIGSTTERLLNRLPASVLVIPVAQPAERRRARRHPSRRREKVVL